MPQHIFEVELPSGEILEIDAPASTPQAAIKDRARQYLIQQQQAHPPGVPKPALPSGLQPESTGSGPMSDMILGVDSTTFGHRLMGAASAVTNGIFPAGDTPRPNALPQLSPQEEIGAKAATIGAVPGLVEAGAQFASHQIPGIMEHLPSSMFRDSETLATRGLKPGGDVNFQKKIPLAMDELRSAERQVGPLNSYEKVLEAGKAATLENNRVFNMILKDQSGIKMPGSGELIQRAQIEAIPDSVRITQPEEYQRLVAKIMEEPSKDLTFGELNKIRQSDNKILTPKYNKVLTKQLSVDENMATALVKARADTARNLLYTGLDSHGLGGGEAARDIGKRMGAVMSFTDAVEAKANTMVGQRVPALQRGVSAVQRTLTNPLRSVPVNPPAEQDLISAVRRWPGRSKPIQIRLEPKVNTLAGSQMDMIPHDLGSLFPKSDPLDMEQVDAIYQMLNPPGSGMIRSGKLLPEHTGGIPMPPPPTAEERFQPPIEVTTGSSSNLPPGYPGAAPGGPAVKLPPYKPTGEESALAKAKRLRLGSHLDPGRH